MFSGPFIWTHLDFSPLLFCKARTPHSFSVLTNRLFVHFFTWRLVHFSSCLFTFSPICSAMAFRQLRPVMRQTAVREDKAFTQILFVCRREPLLGHSGSCREHCTAKHVALFYFSGGYRLQNIWQGTGILIATLFSRTMSHANLSIPI